MRHIILFLVIVYSRVRSMPMEGDQLTSLTLLLPTKVENKNRSLRQNGKSDPTLYQELQKTDTRLYPLCHLHN